MGVWGLAPSGVQGQSPWSVPLKLTRFCNFKFKFLMKNVPFLRNLNRIHHAENINSIILAEYDLEMRTFLPFWGGALAPVAPPPSYGSATDIQTEMDFDIDFTNVSNSTFTGPVTFRQLYAHEYWSKILATGFFVCSKNT